MVLIAAFSYTKDDRSIDRLPAVPDKDMTGSLKFPGDLNVCSPCSNDPGRIAASDHYEVGDVAPLTTTEETPAMTEISGFNSKVFKLTVYASQ
jgi:hypothetical protein